MNEIPVRSACAPSLATLQARYLSILPVVERYAPLACRGIKCPQRHDDARQELYSVVWLWLYRLGQRGIDGSKFPASLAFQAARFVRSHRKITGSEKARDVLSPLAQARHGFQVQSLPGPGARRCYHDLYGTGRGQQTLDIYEERLQDNLRSTPAEQATFRLDFADWRASYGNRDKRILDDMAAEERTLALARKHSLSPARISQKRREYHADWQAFCSDDMATGVPERRPSLQSTA